MRHRFEIDGREVRAESEWVGGQLWIRLNGKTFVYEDETKKRQGKRASSGQAGDILAPMPGKVTKVLRQKGDSVMKGDAILVMEAMKMEYTLKSEGPGRVEKVDCQPGDQVTLGKVLVKIVPTA